MSILKRLRYKIKWSVPVIPLMLLANTTRVLADGGGALPSTNPFQVKWDSVMNGGVVLSLLPLFNYGLGLYGCWILFHGIRHLLGKSKKLMEGQVSYKEFIPVVAGFCMVLLVLSGAWYHLLVSVLVPLNQAFTSTPQ
ncbi:hypothetical protein [Desulfosporosinus sp. FKA]|uniref:hypothetical protein n=1 Tax=Desulfosporosinus sp. FKA TaxID=1969834 RepID=UPI000B49AF9D|nr:hypothetical protein [Desulfosporosinus sp. FKA]